MQPNERPASRQEITPWKRLSQPPSRSHSGVRIGSIRWKGRFASEFVGFIEEMLEAELDAALQRRRYDRRGPAHGHRHGHRERQLIGTFGPVTVSVPRARLAGVDGRTSEWRNRTIPSYKRLTKRAEALIAATYLAGTNTRRVRRALAPPFGGANRPETVSRAWHKVQTDW